MIIIKGDFLVLLWLVIYMVKTTLVCYLQVGLISTNIIGKPESTDRQVLYLF